MGLLRVISLASVVFLLALTTFLTAQGTSPTTPLTLLSREGRRPVPTTLLNNQELIALDDVASIFQVSVREDTLAGGITVAYKGRTIVISPDQPMASVDGRLVTLPSPLVRLGRRWLVPVEFLARALAPIYDVRLELRRPSRLLLVGDIRVPRVTARIDAPGPPTRATIEIAPAANVSTSIEGGRVLVRVEADALDLTLPNSGIGLVDQFRTEQPTTLTVVMNSRAGMPRVISSTADNVTRIALDVPPIATAESAAVPTPTAPAAPLKPPGDLGTSVPKPPTPEGGPVPAFGAPRPALRAIAIDPGHGGDDTGARGVAGTTTEKQITLDVARRLKSLIETRLGIRVILTRDDDRTIELDQRAAAANNNKADLFLSLHLNAALNPTAKGAEVYYLALDRESEDARRSAEVDAVSLPVLGGGSRAIEVIRWDLAQARHVDASAALAGMLEEELRKQVPLSARPIREAPARVLSGVDMPAVLLEIAYLTNPEQEKQVQTEAYQTTVAQAIYDTIVRFRSYVESRSTP